MSWTIQQQQAIDAVGNTLVSAGAGSGKTAVLTERIYTLLQKNKDLTIENLLVLTFTEAAASSMKQKVKEKLIAYNDQKNLLLLPSSQITTFDGFTLNIVNQYYQEIGLQEKIKVCDPSLVVYQEKKILDTIFDEYYEKPNESFKNLIKAFVLDNDKSIKEVILNLKRQFELTPDPQETIDKYFEIYSKEIVLEKVTKILSDRNKQCSSRLNELLEVTIDHQWFRENITIIRNDPYSFEFNKRKIKPKSSPQLSDWIDQIKDALNDLSSTNLDRNQFQLEWELTLSHKKILLDIVKKLILNMDQWMLYHNRFSFNKIARMGIDILKLKHVSDELKEQYRFIMIDEYQDTSDIQERFVSLLENNNLFMVGDIKQSIYRFRNANPKIFKEKYQKYGQNSGGQKIDLLDNFRSRIEVIEGVNAIFSNLMTLENGGANYKEDHLMKASNRELNDIKHQNISESGISKNRTKKIEFDESYQEIEVMVGDIVHKLNTGYEVYDERLERKRKVHAGDFAIITPTNMSQQDIARALNEKGLFVNVVGKFEVKDNPVFLTFYNLVQCLRIENFKNDKALYHLTGLARSFLFKINDDEITDIILNQKSFYFEKQLDALVLLKNELSPGNYVIEILKQTEFIYKCRTLKNLETALNIVEKLVSLAKSIEESKDSFDSFVDMLTMILNSEIKLELDSPKGTSESVTVINIHKSKGLQYPICYFPFLAKNFNQADVRSPFSFDSELGLIVPVVTNRFNKGSRLRVIRGQTIEQEDVSEKIRLFYVALTRAQEEIILLWKKNDDTFEFRSSFAGFIDSLPTSKIDVHSIVEDTKYVGINIGQDVSSKQKVTFKPVPVQREVMQWQKASKEVDELDENTLLLMRKGTHLHEIFEWIDLKNPNYDGLSSQEKIIVQDFMNCGLSFDFIQSYHEYEFFEDQIHGKIDLILEYEHEIVIVDFKMSNVMDVAYQNQLSIYQTVCEKRFNKIVRISLYSIMKKTLTWI